MRLMALGRERICHKRTNKHTKLHPLAMYGYQHHLIGRTTVQNFVRVQPLVNIDEDGVGVTINAQLSANSKITCHSMWAEWQEPTHTVCTFHSDVCGIAIHKSFSWWSKLGQLIRDFCMLEM